MTTKVTDVEQNPDRCADIAAALHLLALKFTDLIGTGVPVPFIQLYVQPGRHGDDESVVAAVDAVCSVLLGHAGQVQEMSDEIYHYSNGEGSEPVGAVSVRIFKPVSAEFAARREAELAEGVPAVPNYGHGDEARPGAVADQPAESKAWTHYRNGQAAETACGQLVADLPLDDGTSSDHAEVTCKACIDGLPF